MVVTIGIGPTDRIVLIGPTDRNGQVLSPNLVDQAFNLWADPDRLQAWVVPPECQEAVVDRLWVHIIISV
jgi:hypothetical protein